MAEKKELKREEIKRLLLAGKTRKEIQEFTGYDRSYIWEVAEALKLKLKETGQ